MSYSLFGSYANDSSSILIGISEDQRLLLLGGSVNLREHGGRWWAAEYTPEVIPVALLGSPHLIFDQTSVYAPGSVIDPYFPPGYYSSDGLDYSKCFAGSGTESLHTGPILGNQPPNLTVTYSLQCSHSTTYGAGLSPLGEKVTLFPKARIHGYVVENAGFLMFTRNVPVSDSTRFNYTAEFGAGVEWRSSPGRTWSLDARFHHTSNGFRGEFDPGIDQILIRLSRNVRMRDRR